MDSSIRSNEVRDSQNPQCEAKLNGQPCTRPAVYTVVGYEYIEHVAHEELPRDPVRVKLCAEHMDDHDRYCRIVRGYRVMVDDYDQRPL